jgi:phosphoenolpyruvate carboxylase
MSARRRSGFGGWISRLEGWKLVAVFVASAVTAGTLVLGGFTSFERQYGILAANFGFARQVSVAKDIKELKVETKQETTKILSEVQRIQLWQLYDQIKRTQRNIDNLKEKKTLTPIEREQLQDFGTQLSEATKDYQKLVEKVKGP